jgi:UDP-N-acetyl-2-amino-2-deoxyglucuronate dehydrogenase
MKAAAESPVRMGLIGAGAIMRLSHAPTIAASSLATLVGVFDKDRARAQALASDFNIPMATTDLAELLDRKDVEAVVVATPNIHHPEAVISAARAGKHVFCEKPLAMDIQSAKTMVDACEQAGVALQVGFNQRYWNQVKLARSLLDSGVIGKVHAVRSVYSERWDAYPAATRYRYDLAQSGGATIIDLTIHRIDLLRHLVGEFASIFAELAHCEVPEPVDDNVWLLARFRNGARGGLLSDRYSPAIGDGTDIYGSAGTIHLVTETINPFHAAPLAVYTEKRADELPDSLRQAYYPDAWWKTFAGGWITVRPPRQSPYAAQFEAFCRSVRTGAPPEVSGQDGLRAQEVVQGAYLSMRDGRWVDLPLPLDAPLAIPSYASNVPRS